LPGGVSWSHKKQKKKNNDIDDKKKKLVRPTGAFLSLLGLVIRGAADKEKLAGGEDIKGRGKE